MSLLTHPDDIFSVYEIIWRLKILQFPLLKDWYTIIYNIHNKYNPFPNRINRIESSITPLNEPFSNLPWDEIGRQWVEIAFFLLGSARYYDDEHNYNYFIELLSSIAAINPEWVSRLYWEKCQYSLMHLNQPALKKLLREWPSNEGYPFEEIRRATILTEIGELREAENITKASLSTIRQRLDPYSVDHTLLSQEGWGIYLLRNIDLAINHFQTPVRAQINNRKNTLENNLCYPWAELYKLYNEINSLKVVPKEEILKGYDPHTISHTYHSESGIDKRYQYSFSLLRSAEEGSIPFHLSGVTTLDKQAMTKLIEYLFMYHPIWCISVAVRTHNREVMNNILNRYQTATLPEKDIDAIFMLCINSLNDSISSKLGINENEKSLIGSILSSIPEILSRLCIRLNDNQRDTVFQMAIKLYNLSIQSNIYYTREKVSLLFGRLLYSSTRAECEQWLPQLMSLPIIGDSSYLMRFNGDLDPKIEPSYHIELREKDRLYRIDTLKLESAKANLLRIARYGGLLNIDNSTIDEKSIIELRDNARTQAILRLYTLLNINALNTNELDLFAQALWHQDWIEENGLPKLKGFLSSFFLLLPTPSNIDIKDKIHNYLLSESSVTNSLWVRECRFSSKSLFSSSLSNDKRIDWSAIDALELLNKCISWWDHNRESKKMNSYWFGLTDIKDTFEEISNFCQR